MSSAMYFDSIYKFIIEFPYMSDPTLSDVDFKNKMAMVWTTLKILYWLVSKFIPIKKLEFGQSDLVFFICIKALHTKCEYVDVCVGGGISKRKAKSYRQLLSISLPTQTPPHSNLVQIVDVNEKYSVGLSNLHLWHTVKIIMQKDYERGNITWLTCFSILLVFYSG